MQFETFNFDTNIKDLNNKNLFKNRKWYFSFELEAYYDGKEQLEKYLSIDLTKKDKHKLKLELNSKIKLLLDNLFVFDSKETKLVKDVSLSVKGWGYSFEYLPKKPLELTKDNLNRIIKGLSLLHTYKIKPLVEGRCGFHTTFSYEKLDKYDGLWAILQLSHTEKWKNFRNMLYYNNKNSFKKISLLNNKFANTDYFKETKKLIDNNKLHELVNINDKYRFLRLHPGGWFEWRSPRGFISHGINAIKGFYKTVISFIGTIDGLLNEEKVGEYTKKDIKKLSLFNKIDFKFGIPEYKKDLSSKLSEIKTMIEDKIETKFIINYMIDSDIDKFHLTPAQIIQVYELFKNNLTPKEFEVATNSYLQIFLSIHHSRFLIEFFAKVKDKNIINKMFVYKLITNNSTNVNQVSLLTFAVLENNLYLVSLLLKMKSTKINTVSNINNKTPLYYAIKLGFISIVKLLLKNENIKTNIKSTKYENTPLMLAVKKGKYKMVKELLKHKDTDINTQDIKKETPLMVAIQKEKLYIAYLLLKETNIDLKIKNRNNQTAKNLFLKSHNSKEKLLKLYDICNRYDEDCTELELNKLFFEKLV